MKALNHRDKKVLKYILEHRKEGIYHTPASTALKISNSTFRRALKSLHARGALVSDNIDGIYAVTSVGLDLLASEHIKPTRDKKVVNSTLSLHDIRYRVSITSAPLSKAMLCKLSPISPIHSVEMKGHVSKIVYCKDYTLSVHLKTIFIEVPEKTGIDLKELSNDSFLVAMQALNDLEGLGVEYSSISLEKTHFARVEGLMGQLFTKFDDKYFFEHEGHKIWVDRSLGKDRIEDETNTKLSRERLDDATKGIIDGTFDTNNMVAMQSITRDLVQITALNSQLQQNTDLQLNTLASAVTSSVELGKTTAHGVNAIVNLLKPKPEQKVPVVSGRPEYVF